MPAYYPIFLDIRDRRCVVIGGGDLGKEKVDRLLEFGAKVVVVSTQISSDLVQTVDNDKLAWVQRSYRYGDLEGAFIALVVDTSDTSINQSVYKEAKERNIPLNVADVTHLCTWITPAIVKRGDVIVAASTGGASPALARKMREELSGISPRPSKHRIMDLADLAPLLSKIREELMQNGVRIKPDHWQECLTDELVDIVQSGDLKRASKMLKTCLMKGVEDKTFQSK